MWCDKRVLRSPWVWPAVCLAFSGMLSAGHRPAANTSLAPGCVAGECRPAPARVPAIQGALLQAAALSVVAGPGVSQHSSRQLKELPRRSKARLPSWYRRAQAAQLRDQTRPAERLGARSLQSATPVRVREPAPAAAGPHSREPLRLARASTSTHTASEPPAVRRPSQPRLEARATRRRRLIEESLEQSFEAHEREPREVQGSGCAAFGPPLSLGSENFTQVIRNNLLGSYVLAEPVVIKSTENLPLKDHWMNPDFAGCLYGTEKNSLKLDLEKEDGNLALFAGLSHAHINLTVSDSRLISHNGSVALFGGKTTDSTLDLKVRNSTLTAMGGTHAALVEDLAGAESNLTLSMNDTNITALRNGTRVQKGGEDPGNRLAAAPVALASGERSNLLVHNSHGNRVEAMLQERPGDNSKRPLAVASLGWAYVDEIRSDNDLIQMNISDNSVRAQFTDLESRQGSAHASLAGSYAPGHDEVHNLEQWAVEDNRVEARVSGEVDGIGVASLGMVHDAYIQPGSSILFHIRQQRCRNNTVTASVPASNSSMAVTSLALATDDSTCGARCQMRCEGGCTRFSSCEPSCPDVEKFWVLHSQVSDNTMVTEGGNPGVNSATLVGSLGKPEVGPKTSLFLFSGGDKTRPLSIEDNAVISGLARLNLTVVDRDGYSFNGTGVAHKGACPLDAFEQSSTQPEGWKEINRFYCDKARDRFEMQQLQKLPGCPDGALHNTTACHSPGETFLKLVPVPDTDRWLLVTRQTWPAGSQGNSSSTDVFRLLPFSVPHLVEEDPVLRAQTNEADSRYDPAGSVYNGTRVVPEGSELMQALAVNGSNGTLHLVFQDSRTSSLRRASLPHDDKAQTERPFDNKPELPLPSGSELMLLSNEEGGVHAWIRRHGTVEHWPLEQDATAPNRTIPLSSDDDPPLALARDGEFLYSLHNATAADASMEPEYRVQRWNLASNSPDSCWTVNWQDPLSGRLVADNCTLQLEPDDAMPVGNGSVVLKPQVPDGGGCLTWDRVTRSLEQLNLCDSGTACPTSAASSSAAQPSPTVTDQATSLTTTAAPSSTRFPTSTLADIVPSTTSSATLESGSSASMPVASSSMVQPLPTVKDSVTDATTTAAPSSTRFPTSTLADMVSSTASSVTTNALSSDKGILSTMPVVLVSSTGEGRSEVPTVSSTSGATSASAMDDSLASSSMASTQGSTTMVESSDTMATSSRTSIPGSVTSLMTADVAGTSGFSVLPSATTGTADTVTDGPPPARTPGTAGTPGAAAASALFLVPAAAVLGGAAVGCKYCRKGGRQRLTDSEKIEMHKCRKQEEEEAENLDNPDFEQAAQDKSPVDQEAERPASPMSVTTWASSRVGSQESLRP